MKQKTFAIIAVTVLALVLIAVFTRRYTTISPRTEFPINSAPIEYASKDFPIHFIYPHNYFFVERQYDSTNEGPVRREVVFYEDTLENRNVLAGNAPGREGPVTISLYIIPNTKKLSASDWIEKTSFSNWELSTKTLTSISLGGKEAVEYQWSGLYQNDTVVHANSDFIFMFVVSYITPADAIRSDFRSIINSVGFEERY